ncbi:hypothetical protein [Nocardia sp. NPDC003963]
MVARAQSADETGGFSPGDRWVPVDRRWFGLDRATITPALVVIVVAIVMGVVLPAVNRAVPYDDRVRPGDVMALRGGIEFTPVPGWGITQGVRADAPPVGGSYPTQAVVVDGPLRFGMETGTFSGTTAELLSRIQRTDELSHRGDRPRVTGDPVAIVTRDGLRGLLVRYSDTHTDGALAAFVVAGTGVEVVATGPIDTPPRAATDIAEMLISIAHTGTES